MNAAIACPAAPWMQLNSPIGAGGHSQGTVYRLRRLRSSMPFRSHSSQGKTDGTTQGTSKQRGGADDAHAQGERQAVRPGGRDYETDSCSHRGFSPVGADGKRHRLVHPPIFTWFSGPLITAGLGFIMLGMGLTLTRTILSESPASRDGSWPGLLFSIRLCPFGLGSCEVFRPSGFFRGRAYPRSLLSGRHRFQCYYLPRESGPSPVGDHDQRVNTSGSTSPRRSVRRYTRAVAWMYQFSGLFLSTAQVILLPVILGVADEPLPPGYNRTTETCSTGYCRSVHNPHRGFNHRCRPGDDTRVGIFSYCRGVHTAYIWIFHGIRRFPVNFKGYHKLHGPVSIEVGMQNSGLGVVLARANFANPAVAIPSAISSLFHSLIASLLAAVWRRTGFDSTH